MATTQDTNEPTAKAAVEPPAEDAFELLKADHQMVEGLFDAFEKTASSDLDAKGTLVQRACEALTVHAMLEEELFYPAANKALKGDQKIDVDEAYVEHYLVKMLITKFELLKPGDRGFDATFKVMSEMVRHHIEEEETTLFPELRKSGLDAIRLGKDLALRKAALTKALEEDGSKLIGDNSLKLVARANE
jgi:hemerythrin superfamily protein